MTTAIAILAPWHPFWVVAVLVVLPLPVVVRAGPGPIAVARLGRRRHRDLRRWPPWR